MAVTVTPYASVTFLDSANRKTTTRIRVSEADAKAYVAAADEAAADATNVGLLLASIDDLTELTFVAKGVDFVYEENSPVLPTAAFRGNKAVFGYGSASARDFTISIPGRDNTVLNLNGVSIPVSGGAESTEVAAFNTQLVATGLDINGNAITGLIYGRIND